MICCLCLSGSNAGATTSTPSCHSTSPPDSPSCATTTSQRKTTKGGHFTAAYRAMYSRQRSTFQNRKGLHGFAWTERLQCWPAVACCRNIRWCFLSCVLGFCVSLDFVFPRTILGAPEKIHSDSERMGRQPIPNFL